MIMVNFTVLPALNSKIQLLEKSAPLSKIVHLYTDIFEVRKDLWLASSKLNFLQLQMRVSSIIKENVTRLPALISKLRFLEKECAVEQNSPF